MSEIKKEWVKTRELAEALSVSQWYVLKRIRPESREDYHYSNISPQKWRPNYRFHLERCKAWMEGKKGDESTGESSPPAA